MIDAKKVLVELEKELSEMTLEQRYDYARKAGFAVKENNEVNIHEVNIHEVNIHEIGNICGKSAKSTKNKYKIFTLTKPMRNVA